MSKVVRLNIPEPIKHKGRERFVSGWSTAGIGQWLIKRKRGDYTPLSEIASTAFPRDSQENREKVKRNLSALRRWLADRDEFLLVRFTNRRITAVKIYNQLSDNDQQEARIQLMRLVARCEIDEAERERWEGILLLADEAEDPEAGA